MARRHDTPHTPPATGGANRRGGWERRSWLGDLDSNQGCPGQSREFYR